MKRERMFVLGAITAIVFLLVQIKLTRNEVVIKSVDKSITIKHEKVRESGYLRMNDETNPSPQMYKEHLEDALVYAITEDDYQQMYYIQSDINYALLAENEDLKEYLNYLKDLDGFEQIKLLIGNSPMDKDAMREITIKLLDKSMKYNGL